MSDSKKPDYDKMSIDEIMAELEKMLGRLEQGEDSLEESFSLYEQGIKLVKVCNQKIDAVEKKCRIVDEGGDYHEF